MPFSPSGSPQVLYFYFVTVLFSLSDQLFPDISDLSLKRCMAVDIAKQIGIFVPDHGPNELLLKLNLSTAQMEALKAVTQSIEELLPPVELPTPKTPRLGSECRVQLNSSPNLLDIPDAQSLDQALSVFVYMISNNLLSGEQSRRFILWILKKGHATSLLAFSRRPVVDNLAFGSAFLRAFCESAPIVCGVRTGDSILISNFISSKEFLSLVKNHQEFLSGPLGIALFRLAAVTDNMELAKLLGHQRLDVASNHVLPWDHHNLKSDGTSVLSTALFSHCHSVLEYVIRLAVDANKDTPGALVPGLRAAISRNNLFAAQALFGAGAPIPDDINYSQRWMSSNMRGILGFNSKLVLWELVNAAQKGNRELSKACLAYRIVSPHGLEDAMCKAIELGDLPATRTFLQRQVNPNVGLATFRNCLDDEVGECPMDADILYLLCKAGAQINDDTALSIRNFAHREPGNSQLEPLLRILLSFNYDEAWVHQYLVTLYAHDGYIFECDTCIDKGARINVYGHEVQSALQAAAMSGRFPLVQHLICQGADPNLPPSSDHPYGETALYAALARGHWDVASHLIECGVDVTAKATTGGFTFLEGVVAKVNDNGGAMKMFSCIATFRNLLALGAPVNRSNGTASFLVHGLLYWSQFECLELALEAGARIEDKSHGISPIQLAVLRKDSVGLQSFLEHGANVNGPPSSSSNHTITYQRPSSIPFWWDEKSHFFDTGCETDLSSGSGFRGDIRLGDELYFPHTPLQIASSCCHQDLRIIQLLLRHGADINAAAAELHGRTALQGAICAQKLNMDVVNMLLDRGADVNAPPAQVGGLTALQGAAIQGNIQLVRLLLARGADINALGSPEEGRTVLEGAAEHGRIEMLRFLLSRGAAPDPVTGYSRAIELAEKELHFGIVKFLREEQRKLDEMRWSAGLPGLGWDCP